MNINGREYVWAKPLRFCSKLLQLAAIGLRVPWTRHLSERLRSSECHAVAPRRARTWRRCPSPRAPTPRRWPRVPWRRSRPDSVSVPTAMRTSAASHPVGRQSVAASDAVPASVSHPARAFRRRGVPRRVHHARMARVPAALFRFASRGDALRRRAACGAFRGRSGPRAVRPRSSSSCQVGRRYRMPSRNSYREARPASTRRTQVRSQSSESCTARSFAIASWRVSPRRCRIWRVPIWHSPMSPHVVGVRGTFGGVSSGASADATLKKKKTHRTARRFRAFRRHGPPRFARVPGPHTPCRPACREKKKKTVARRRCGMALRSRTGCARMFAPHGRASHFGIHRPRLSPATHQSP